jgi:hypothetical protein
MYVLYIGAICLLELFCFVTCFYNIIETVAGTGNTYPQYSGAGPTEYGFSYPYQVVVDDNDNIWAVDPYSQIVMEITPDNAIIIAGVLNIPGYLDVAPASSSLFNSPKSLAVNNSFVYVVDQDNFVIREINLDTGGFSVTTSVSTIAGNHVAGDADCSNRPISTNQTNIATYPTSLTYSEGYIYFVDYYCGIYRFIPNNDTTFESVYSKTGNNAGIFVDSFSNIYFIDQFNSQIYKILNGTNNGIVIAGNGSSGYYGDNMLATQAMLKQPTGIFVDSNLNIYIADYLNCRIRYIDNTTGIIITYAGTGVCSFDPNEIIATETNLNLPSSVWLMNDISGGSLLISDAKNRRIRKIYTPIPSSQPTSPPVSESTVYIFDISDSIYFKVIFPIFWTSVLFVVYWFQFRIASYILEKFGHEYEFINAADWNQNPVTNGKTIKIVCCLDGTLFCKSSFGGKDHDGNLQEWILPSADCHYGLPNNVISIIKRITEANNGTAFRGHEKLYVETQVRKVLLANNYLCEVLLYGVFPSYNELGGIKGIIYAIILRFYETVHANSKASIYIVHKMQIPSDYVDNANPNPMPSP